MPYARSRPRILRYRSHALTDENAIDELRTAQAIATKARAAAAEARFSEPPTSSLAKTIPSIQELRQAAGVLRSTGFLGKLFGREWRAGRAVCRRTFPEETKLEPIEAANRFMAAALWKYRVERLEGCAEAKIAAGRYWSGAETPFENLISVAEWMRSISESYPHERARRPRAATASLSKHRRQFYGAGPTSLKPPRA